ncbi:transposase [[Collinsella] massiliensis]|uniref:Transposase IS200-like domain-containing protein n=1 Tax=[Collinsella] massiliensis TaxID=1232426 RepID=A0A1Y3XW14_9ACTN|nr:transposase [[Collinsella] massiliensis]OUN86230.1 hypothetical protein B5G02_08615 [[Collinsella] massiliensis]
MPSAPRRIAESGLYHVVARGNGKQVIFTDDRDREAFLAYLERFMREDEIALIAWCLMDNHVHLIVEDTEQRLPHAMGGVLGAYAKYFNQKTGHVGSVFQPRFFSEAIEGDERLIAAVRYVHINPEKAGICEAAHYPWSSYREYAGGAGEGAGAGEGTGEGLCATGLVLGLLGGPEGFSELCSGASAADVGFEGSVKLSSDEALEVANRVVRALGCPDVFAVKSLPIPRRNAVVAALRGNCLTIKQIERLTGLGSGVIARIK